MKRAVIFSKENSSSEIHLLFPRPTFKINKRKKTRKLRKTQFKNMYICSVILSIFVCSFMQKHLCYKLVVCFSFHRKLCLFFQNDESKSFRMMRPKQCVFETSFVYNVHHAAVYVIETYQYSYITACAYEREFMDRYHSFHDVCDSD